MIWERWAEVRATRMDRPRSPVLLHFRSSLKVVYATNPPCFSMYSTHSIRCRMCSKSYGSRISPALTAGTVPMVLWTRIQLYQWKYRASASTTVADKLIREFRAGYMGSFITGEDVALSWMVRQSRLTKVPGDQLRL